MTAPHPVSIRNAPSFAWQEVCEGWTFVSTGKLHVIQERMPHGASELRHVHRRTHQFYFILHGGASVEIDGTEHALDRGDGIEIPPGSVHQLRNATSAPLEFLVISTQPPRSDRTDLEEQPAGKRP
jgi:mannose-6-phosphate isomerase-like protein (cupin superfamily)